MLSMPQQQGLLFVLLLACLFINGCVGTGPQSQSPTPSPVAGQEQPLNERRIAQQALAAFEQRDYQKALPLFKQAVKKQQLAAAELYYYAHALYANEAYAEAIEIYDQYLEKLGRQGDYFLAALDKRNNAVEKLQQQQTAEVKASQAQTALTRIAASLEANWLVVKVQTANRVASFTEPLTGIEMLLVPGGCYQMGDQFGTGEADEQPVHQICIDDFYLGKYEVTQSQWQLVMGYNPSQKSQGEQFPVDSISWNEATEFTSILSGETGLYRLPTEAEWEYAARSGGKKQQFSGSDSADAVAWHAGNSAGSAHPVGQKQANDLGFYDMSGNLYEWCLDRYTEDYYLQSPEQNPTGPAAGTERVRRGGSWDSRISYSRASYRTERHETDYRADHTGFRLALPLTD